MSDYQLRLIKPPEPPPPVALKAQTLPCAGRWWWADSPSTPVACPEEGVICTTVLTSPFDGGVWVRGFFVYDTTVEGEEPASVTSVVSNIVEYGCPDGATLPEPVPEPGFVCGLIFGTLVILTLRSIFR